MHVKFLLTKQIIKMGKNPKLKTISDMVAKRESVDAMLETLRKKQAEGGYATLQELMNSYVEENCDDDRTVAEGLINGIEGVSVVKLTKRGGKYHAQATQNGKDCHLWVRKTEKGTWEHGAGDFVFQTILDPFSAPVNHLGSNEEE